MGSDLAPPTEDENAKTSGQCCTATHSLTETELASDIQLLSAIGNATRYEALRLIADSSSDVCVCELEPALGVSQSAVSQALSRLYAAGLVSRRKEGRWRYYAATPQAAAILNAVDEVRGQTDE